MEYEYKVIDVADGAISSALLGDGRIETAVLEAYINAMAAEGWRMVFMAKVMQRHVVVAERETLMVTFERRVPEDEREARAARCIDDIIAAEDGARRVGRKAAAGAVGLAVGGTLLSALLVGNSDNLGGKPNGLTSSSRSTPGRTGSDYETGERRQCESGSRATGTGTGPAEGRARSCC